MRLAWAPNFRPMSSKTPQRSMAERAGAKITEADGSHVSMVSQPQVALDAILAAAAHVSE